MIIIDDQTIQENLQKHVLNVFSENRNLSYSHEASGRDVKTYNPIFTHLINKGENIMSELFFLMLPLVTFCHNIHGLNVKYIVRSRLFWQPATIIENNYLHDDYLHRDFQMQDDERGTNFLYYCNESDGGTFIFNENENDRTLRKHVEHKKGRFVIFDAKLWHAGSKPTKNTRLVLNVNSIIE